MSHGARPSLHQSHLGRARHGGASGCCAWYGGALPVRDGPAGARAPACARDSSSGGALGRPPAPLSPARSYVDRAAYEDVHRSSAAMAAFKQATAGIRVQVVGQSYIETNRGFMVR